MLKGIRRSVVAKQVGVNTKVDAVAKKGKRFLNFF